MTVDVQLAADRLIELGYDHGRPLTQIEVQKLLYFLEGWHLALEGLPLFAEDFVVWKHGPVVQSVYERLKRYGAGEIPRGEIRSAYAAELGDLILDLSSRVFETYREHDPGALVGLTHLPGTPWDETRRQHDLPKGANSSFVISKEMIQQWFSAVWAEALTSAGEGLMVAEPEDYAAWSASAA